MLQYIRNNSSTRSETQLKDEINRLKMDTDFLEYLFYLVNQSYHCDYLLVCLLHFGVFRAKEGSFQLLGLLPTFPSAKKVLDPEVVLPHYITVYLDPIDQGKYETFLLDERLSLFYDTSTRKVDN